MLMSLPPDTSITILLDPEELEAPFKVAARLSCHFTMIFIATLLEVDGASKRVDANGQQSKLDPGNSTPAEAYAAIDNAARWTGAGVSRFRAKLGRAKRATASRWG
jgi:hypothetical protein